MMFGIPKFVNDEIDSLDKRNRESAKKWADGEDEIESSIYNQFSAYNPFEEWNFHFYESFVITIYSFYEKTLKMLTDRHLIKIPQKIKGDYAYKYFNLINEFIEQNNLQLSSDSCSFSAIIKNKYKYLRNYLVHHDKNILNKLKFINKEAGIELNYDGIIVFNDDRLLIKILGYVECILLDINEKLEHINKLKSNQ